MRHIQALSKGYLQHLISVCDRPEYYMHAEFAGVVSEFFKFQELELDAKVRNGSMKSAISFSFSGFK